MNADKVAGITAGFRKAGYRQGRRVGTPDSTLSQAAFHLLGDLMFEFDVLKHRLNNQVAAL